MIRRVRIVTFAVALSAFILTPVEGESMNQKLSGPAAVPLEFLNWVGKDARWLRDGLAQQGVSSGYAISNGVLEASTLASLRAANRIRRFAYLAAPGLKLPYFDLSVDQPGGGPVRCVTLFPRSIAPGIGPLDFDRKSFPPAGADPAILEMCRVEPKAASAYAALDRNAFRDRYFDAAGDLKIEFAESGSDPAFLAQAIDHGFFVIQQDYTGRPRLSRE